MKNWLGRVGWIVLIVLGLFARSADDLGAQTNTLTITIVKPAESETLYAAPGTLLYTTQVTGWVVTSNPEPSLVRVRLEILRGTEKTGEAATRLRQDGSFTFDVTVNPDAQRGEFNIAEIENGCENCHYLADLRLPNGEITLRVTATEPSGQHASAERRIIVDRTGYATVPVRVVRADQPLADVPVSGATRFYMWRARHSMARTNDAGEARLLLEVSSQVPTPYIFRVEPTLIEGRLYESVAPITVTLPAGATTAAPITLRVTSRAGQITGKLSAPSKPIPVHAIDLDDGASFTTQTTASGAFTFAEIPIGRYLVLADAHALAEQGAASGAQMLDLTQVYSASLTLPLVPTTPNAVRGTLRDTKGAALPFAWVTIEKTGDAQSIAPNSGAYEIAELPHDALTIVASAPGYYNQAQVVEAAPNAVADFALVRKPETQSIPWGSGEMIAPPESALNVSAHQIALTYGWLWGAGGDDRPREIRLPETSITISAGKFAVEYFPDRAAWLYVFDGTATVRALNSSATATVRAGEMLVLTNPAQIKPVPLDPIAIATLHPTSRSPVAPVWEPSVDAQVRDRFAQMGIGAAQITALITYSLVMLAFVFTPLSTIIWAWRRRQARNKNKDRSLDGIKME